MTDARQTEMGAGARSPMSDPWISKQTQEALDRLRREQYQQTRRLVEAKNRSRP